jgi:hypothetical protein
MSDRDTVTRFLQRYRRAWLTVTAVNRLTATGALFLGFAALLALLFAVFPWTAIPLIFDIAALTFVVMNIGMIVYRAWMRPTALLAIARHIETAGGEPHPLLSIAIELDESDPRFSPDLTALALASAAASLTHYPVRPVNALKSRRALLAGILLLLFAVIAAVTNPSLLRFADLPLRWMQATGFDTAPGSVTIARDATVTLRCRPLEAVYPSAQLERRELNAAGGENLLLRPDSSGGFTFISTDTRRSFVYRFALGRHKSGFDTITVVDPPGLYSLQVTLTPPTYTGRPAITLPEGQGAITAYSGTTARFSIRSHFPLRRGRFLSSPADTVELPIVNGAATGAVILSHSASYTFALQDSLGQANDSLPSFFIDIIPDAPPTIRIIKPGRNAEIQISQQETLWVEGTDDLGVRDIALEWRRSADPTDSAGRRMLPLQQPAVLARLAVAWDIRELSLYPGDTLYYWAKIRDFRPGNPPQGATSDTFWLRVPTFTEINERIAQRQSASSDALTAVRNQQRTTQSKLDNLLKSDRGEKTLSWEEKKTLEDLNANMQTQVDSLQKAVSTLQETVETMRKEGALNPQIAAKMDQIRKAIDEIIAQYGDSLLFKKVDPHEEISWKDVRQSLESMQKMLPELQENLDKTLAYLEAFKRDQTLANLAARASKLAQRQMQLAANAEKAGDAAQRPQSDLLDDVGKLSDDLKQPPGSPADEAIAPTGAEKVDSLAQAMAGALKRGAMPKSSAMSQLSAGLQELSDELSAMMSDAMMARMLKDREMLLSMAGNTIDLAGWQREQPEEGDDSGALSATRQQAIRDALKKLLAQLDSLGATPPAMLSEIMAKGRQAMQAMDGALAAMGEGDPGSSMQAGAQAANGLNGLAGSLLSSAEGMMQGGEGSGSAGQGMMSGLRKLSGKQAALNAMTGALLQQLLQGRQPGGKQGGGQGNQPGQGAEGQTNEAAREAAQRAQSEIAEQLKDLAERYGKGAGKESGAGEARRLQELEAEARRLSEMLQNPGQDLADRQDRFLVRMLQTTLSMHREDEGKEERKSSSAITVFSSSGRADSFDDSGAADSFYALRRKALQGNFPEIYRSTIQAYFDSLGVLFLKNQGTQPHQ